MVTSTAPALQSSARLFPYDKWGQVLPALARQYRDNYPCPHIRLIDFLKPETASAMADEFPQPSSRERPQHKAANEKQLGHDPSRTCSSHVRRADGRTELTRVRGLVVGIARNPQPDRGPDAGGRW